MRTTVTIGADTETLIREEAARMGQSFQAVLNQSVRRALGPRTRKARVEPVFRAPVPTSLPGGSFNRVAAQWADEDTVKELSR